MPFPRRYVRAERDALNNVRHVVEDEHSKVVASDAIENYSSEVLPEEVRSGRGKLDFDRLPEWARNRLLNKVRKKS